MKKLSSAVLIIAAVVLVIAALSLTRALQSFEWWTYDLRFQLRPPQPIADNIVIIEIDDHTLKGLGQWPLPRDLHAGLTTILNEAGARAIVFDFLFSEPTAEDAVLAEAIRKAPNVYLPVAFYIDTPGVLVNSVKNKFPPLLADIVTAFKDAGARIGHINAITDPDGKSRALPLYITQPGNNMPLLGFAAAARTLGLDPGRWRAQPGLVTVDGRLRIPTLGNNAILINYPAAWENSFATFSYLDILKSYKDQAEGKTPRIPLSYFKDKVCFIGLTATGTVDLKPSPIDNLYPMIGAQASVYNSIVTNNFIRPAGPVRNTVINIAVFLFSLFLCARFPILQALLITLASGGIYFLISYLVFCERGLWIDLFLPLGIMVLTFLGVMVRRFLLEVKKRLLLEKELEIANKIQQSFLPQQPPAIPGLSVAPFFKAAKFVAGDLYDIVKLDERKLGILIGDVSGKGVSAALCMAEAISLFRVCSRQLFEAHEVLTALNQELYGKMGGRFITAIYVIVDLDAKKLMVASAGHGPLLLLRDGEADIKDIPLNGNVPLGLMPSVNYATVTVDLKHLDRFAIFSDGVPEARNADSQEYGQARVNASLTATRGENTQEALNQLTDDLLAFSDRDSQYDDITLIIFSINLETNTL